MPDVAFANELARLGPHAEAPGDCTLQQARDYCRRLARSHYENFTVASWLLPDRLRQHFYNIYAYCRWADDLADETGDPVQSLELLDWWADQLRACYRHEARHPVMVALTESIDEFRIPPEPFLDLLIAFRQDQHQQRYATFDELLGYCRNSANPVGRLVLYLADAHREPNLPLADSICTGLQLANFWQDVDRDGQRGRLYLPLEDLAQFGVAEADLAARRPTAAMRELLRFEVERAAAWLNAGRPLVDQVPRFVAAEVWLFLHGGLRILQRIAVQQYDVWTRRPVVTKADQLRLLAGYLWQRVRGAGQGGGR